MSALFRTHIKVVRVPGCNKIKHRVIVPLPFWTFLGSILMEEMTGVAFIARGRRTIQV